MDAIQIVLSELLPQYHEAQGRSSMGEASSTTPKLFIPASVEASLPSVPIAPRTWVSSDTAKIWAR
jgi:hypothetical protein